MNRMLVVAALACLAACSPKPNAPMTVAPYGDPSIKVERIAVIEDDLAYDARRGVYRITDTTTGQVWIGVSGVGISEVGQHTVSCGKSVCVVQDER